MRLVWANIVLHLTSFRSFDVLVKKWICFSCSRHSLGFLYFHIRQSHLSRKRLFSRKCCLFGLSPCCSRYRAVARYAVEPQWALSNVVAKIHRAVISITSVCLGDSTAALCGHSGFCRFRSSETPEWTSLWFFFLASEKHVVRFPGVVGFSTVRVITDV